MEEEAHEEVEEEASKDETEIKVITCQEQDGLALDIPLRASPWHMLREVVSTGGSSR